MLQEYIIAPSKLNSVLEVPAKPSTVSPAAPRDPPPRVPTHAADVAVVQLDVAQSWSASTAVSV